MSITRHNYEEFFVLYLDNELSLPERRMVEAFVLQHPDLKDDLDLLLQFKFSPDTEIVFDRKEELLAPMNNVSPVYVTDANYQDRLILYLDNELTRSEKNLVEEYLATDPEAEKELVLLKKAKLEPEQIIFENKASLYRTSQPANRIQMRAWRVAAAILLLLTVGTTTAVLISKKPGKPPIVKTNQPVQKIETALAKPEKQQSPPDKIAVVPEKIPLILPQVNKQSKNDQVAKLQQTRVPENKKPIVVRAPNNEKQIASNDQSNTNNLPQPENNPYLKKLEKNDAVADNKSKNQNVLTTSKVTIDPVNPSDIVRASYTDYIKTDEDPDQTDGKKNKLRGFFRKVTRTFEKRTNMDATDNENKLLVGGLTIKLK